MDVLFFQDEISFRRWLEKNHAKATELFVAFRKRDSGRPSIIYPEARDQALCFGWIDGVRRSLDNDSYTIRFTPRKPRSIWSVVNIQRVVEMTKLGQMAPAGLKAFKARDEKRSGVYSFENRPSQLRLITRKSLSPTKRLGSSFKRCRHGIGERRFSG